MAGLFITGTDTGVGKTLVTGLLAWAWQEQGRRVITQKWVQSGCNGFSEDIAIHLKLMGRDREWIQGYERTICPYVLALPASAHLAAEIEQQTIDPEVLKAAYQQLSQDFDRVLVEGMGGLLVPYCRHALLVDLICDLDLPVLIVAKNKLGAINHTLLTIEALQQRKIPVLGIVFNGPEGPHDSVTRDNPRIVQEISGVPVFGELPWTEDMDRLKPEIQSIGRAIDKALAKEQPL